jgi:hypothetical protein
MALQMEGLPEEPQAFTVGLHPHDTAKIAITRGVIGETVEDFWGQSLAILEEVIDRNGGHLTYIANRVLHSQIDMPETDKTDVHEIPPQVWDGIVALAGKSGLNPKVIAGVAPVHRAEVLRRDATWPQRWGVYKERVAANANQKLED